MARICMHHLRAIPPCDPQSSHGQKGQGKGGMCTSNIDGATEMLSMRAIGVLAPSNCPSTCCSPTDYAGGAATHKSVEAALP